MPWLRVSDTVAYDPVVVAVLEHPDADERTADELFGFVLRLATLSAQHATDYVSTYSTALVLGGTKPRTDRLLALAEFAGYGVNEVEAESGRRRFRLMDEPKFLHMKTAEELAWESQRKTDNGSPHVVVPVRHRDGDACRYCGKVVNWSDRTGGIGGTYDHRPPGEPASAQTSVVACRSCNSERGAVGRGLSPQDALAAADAVRPLWDVPPAPYYKPATRAWLARHGDVLALYGLVPPPAARSSKVIAAGSPAPGAVPPVSADNAPDGVRPAAADPAPDGVRPAAADNAPDGVRPAAADPAPDGVRPAAADPAPDGVRPAAADNAPDGVRPAAADPAPDGVRPAAADPAPDLRANKPVSPRAGPPPLHKKPGPSSANAPPGFPAGRKGAEVDGPGSGRGGTGRGGLGLAGPGGGGAEGAPPAHRARRRGRRGRRRSGSGGSGGQE